MKKHKVLPKFKTAAEEQAFWQEHDSTEYVDWSSAKKVNFSRHRLARECAKLDPVSEQQMADEGLVGWVELAKPNKQ